MEHIRTLGQAENNTRRIRKIDAWIEGHDKVKLKHERIMVAIGIVLAWCVLSITYMAFFGA